MPIPKPTKGEKQTDYHAKCMSDEVMKKEYPDTEQRNAICFSKWKDHQKNNKEDKMTKDELVKSLIANEGTKFTDKDTEWLTVLNEEQLELMVPVVKVNEIVVHKEDEGDKVVESKEMTYEEMLAKAPASVKAQHAFVANMIKTFRADLITQIKANEHNKFTDAMLEAMDDESLKTLAETLKVEVPVVNYLGQGGSVTPIDNDEVTEEPLTLPSFEEKK